MTEAQVSLIGHGLIVHFEYISATEQAYHKLKQQDVEEPRSDINRVLKRSHTPRPNISKAECNETIKKG